LLYNNISLYIIVFLNPILALRFGTSPNAEGVLRAT